MLRKIAFLFGAIGVLLFAGGVVWVMVEHNPGLFVISAASIPFFGIAGKMLYDDKRESDMASAIFERGTLCHGCIVGYETGQGVMVNNQPPLDVLVEAVIDGIERQIAVPTGEYSCRKYPIGAAVDLKVLGMNARIVPGSIRW